MNTKYRKRNSAFRVVYVTALGLSLVGWASCLLCSQACGATIVDFDGEDNGSGKFKQLSLPYEEDGVVVNATPPVLVFFDRHSSTTGSPYIFPDGSDVEFTIEALDDSWGISLQSITVIEVVSRDVLDVTFIGTRADGSTVSEIVQTEGESDLPKDGGSPETYSFTSLASESFESIKFTAVGSGLGFDNIAVQTAAPVPEPPACWSAAILALCAGMGLHRQRCSTQ